jgi:hypothetical protein
VPVTAIVAIALAAGGLTWIVVLSTLNSMYQLTLPGWVKARGMSFCLIVFQGGNAVGAAVLGVTAEHAGLSPTLLAVPAPHRRDQLAGSGRMRPTRTGSSSSSPWPPGPSTCASTIA